MNLNATKPFAIGGLVWGVISAIYVSLIAGPKVYGEYGLINYMSLSDKILLAPSLWLNWFVGATYGAFPDSFILLAIVHILGSAIIGLLMGATLGLILTMVIKK